VRNVASRLLTAVLVTGLVATVTTAPGVAAPRLVSAAVAERAPAGLTSLPDRERDVRPHHLSRSLSKL
jgi:hypothetical protein